MRKFRAEQTWNVPFCYCDDGKTLLPNESEQKAIGLIFDLRAGGCTLRQIAKTLTQRNISTKEGGTAWTHTAVARILRRKAA